MTKRPLVWTANNAFNHAFSAQVANITYHVATQDYGYPARVEARDPRGGLKRLDLGYYTKWNRPSTPASGTTRPVAIFAGRRRSRAKRRIKGYNEGPSRAG